MNAVVYYSNTGQSRAIAVYAAQKLGYPIFDMINTEMHTYGHLVLVFPVHCQSIPQAVRAFVSRIKAETVTAIAAYGKMWHGNVLYELQTQYRLPIVAAAYVPTKHAYLAGEGFADFAKLNVLFDGVRTTPVHIPKSFQNPFACVLPRIRSQIGVKLTKTSACTACGVCTRSCPYQAIKNGKVNHRCIRCLRCAENCPAHALRVHLRLPLRWYLAKKQVEKLEIYV